MTNFNLSKWISGLFQGQSIKIVSEDLELKRLVQVLSRANSTQSLKTAILPVKTDAAEILFTLFSQDNFHINYQTENTAPRETGI